MSDSISATIIGAMRASRMLPGPTASQSRIPLRRFIAITEGRHQPSAAELRRIGQVLGVDLRDGPEK